jgi:hypothetical protein
MLAPSSHAFLPHSRVLPWTESQLFSALGCG